MESNTKILYFVHFNSHVTGFSLYFSDKEVNFFEKFGHCLSYQNIFVENLAKKRVLSHKH